MQCRLKCKELQCNSAKNGITMQKPRTLVFTGSWVHLPGRQNTRGNSRETQVCSECVRMYVCERKCVLLCVCVVYVTPLHQVLRLKVLCFNSLSETCDRSQLYYFLFCFAWYL